MLTSHQYDPHESNHLTKHLKISHLQSKLHLQGDNELKELERDTGMTLSIHLCVCPPVYPSHSWCFWIDLKLAVIHYGTYQASYPTEQGSWGQHGAHLSAPDGPMNLAIRDSTDPRSNLPPTLVKPIASINRLRLRQMTAISQMTSSNAFCSMKICEFRLKCQWRLFLRVQLTIFQLWFRFMVWHQQGNKPLSEPMMVRLLMQCGIYTRRSASVSLCLNCFQSFPGCQRFCCSPVDSPHKWPIMWSFNVYFVVSRNEQLNKQSGCWWCEMLMWHHSDAIITENSYTLAEIIMEPPLL